MSNYDDFMDYFELMTEINTIIIEKLDLKEEVTANKLDTILQALSYLLYTYSKAAGIQDHILIECFQKSMKAISEFEEKLK